jgi:hypothetical protein
MGIPPEAILIDVPDGRKIRSDPSIRQLRRLWKAQWGRGRGVAACLTKSCCQKLAQNTSWLRRNYQPLTGTASGTVPAIIVFDRIAKRINIQVMIDWIRFRWSAGSDFIASGPVIA